MISSIITAASSFFTSVWSKIAAGLAVSSVFMIMVIKILWASRNKLKRENETLVETAEIISKQAKFKEKVITNEQEKIKQAIDANANKSKLDKLNDFLSKS